MAYQVYIIVETGVFADAGVHRYRKNKEYCRYA